MQNREDEIAKNGIFSRRGYGGKRKSKSTIDEAGLFRKMNKKKSRIDERWVCGFDIYSYFLKKDFFLIMKKKVVKKTVKPIK